MVEKSDISASGSLSREQHLEMENRGLRMQYEVLSREHEALKRDDLISKKFSVLGLDVTVGGSPLPLIAGGVFGLGWNLATTRMTIGHMLMTDDEFAKEFQGGMWQDFVEKHKDEYIRYTTRESKITTMLPDFINSWKKRFSLAREIKNKGVTFGEALSHHRGSHWFTMSGSLAAISIGMHMLHNPPKAQEPKTLLIDSHTPDYDGTLQDPTLEQGKKL